MNNLITKLQKFGRIRQLHTIISQQTIKPAFPTPSHLKTYNLSLLEQIVPNALSNDLVFFYPKYMNSVNTNVLKQSLSQSIGRYYPLAGRFQSPSASYVDCTDEGVDFVEVSTDIRLSDFSSKKYQDETIHHLLPNRLGLKDGKKCASLLQVQLNHFLDGGVAVAVSASHKITDGLTVASFVNHWATIARGELPINPTFLSSPSSYNSTELNEYVPEYTSDVIYKTRTFTFTNSKLNELKKNVIDMGNTPMKLSRFEVLASLLFKSAVSASTNKSYDSFLLHQPFNVRSIIPGKYPERTSGNVLTMAVTKIKNTGQIQLNEMVNELRKRKMEVKGLRDVKEAAQYWTNTLSTLANDQGRVYTITSVCRFPFHNANFGWGKPVKVTFCVPELDQGIFVFMDTPSGDGIEVTARLKEDEMAIFENDKEILAYVHEDVNTY